MVDGDKHISHTRFISKKCGHLVADGSSYLGLALSLGIRSKALFGLADMTVQCYFQQQKYNFVKRKVGFQFGRANLVFAFIEVLQAHFFWLCLLETQVPYN